MNTKKLAAQLTDLQSRVSARTLDMDAIERELKLAEKEISAVLTKKDWAGVTVTISENFGKKPSSYNGTPESTFVTLVRGKTSWSASGPTRACSRTNQRGNFEIFFPEDKAMLIVSHLNGKF